MRMRGVGVAFLAAALSGCWVLDELDEGSKKMDRYMAKKPESEAAAQGAAPAARRGPRVGEYFASQKNARTLTPGTVSSGIVSCKLKNGTQFMKQEECINRGGAPKG
jgi:hypothetical protein